MSKKPSRKAKKKTKSKKVAAPTSASSKRKGAKRSKVRKATSKKPNRKKLANPVQAKRPKTNRTTGRKEQSPASEIVDPAIDMQVDEIMSRLFSSEPSEATDRPKIYIILEPEHPEEDRDGAHTAFVSQQINEHAKRAADLVRDNESASEPMVVDPGAIPPNAMTVNGLQQAVEEDVGDELRRQNEEARRQRTARESLRRAGKLSAAASKEAAAATQKAIVEAGSKLGAEILKYQRWTMGLFNEALAAVAPGTTSHTVLVNIASSCAFEAMRLLG